MLEQKRIEWIDLIRAMAITLVLLCHCSEGIYRFNTDFLTSVGFTSKLFAVTSFTAGRLGVPFFLLISGYLLLDREYDTDKTLRFWKNNWLHLLICTYIWLTIYNIFEMYMSGNAFSMKNLLKEALFLKSSSMNHMWYMPMLLGMYPLIPFVANALRSMKLKTVLFPLILFSVYSFGYPFVNVCRSALGKETFHLTLSLGFSGGTYGLYFIFGYLLKKGLLKKLKSPLLLSLSIGAFLLTVCFQFWTYKNNYVYKVWYDNPLLAVCAVTLFEFLSRMKHVPLYKIAKPVSYYSFAMYLIHNIIRYALLRMDITIMRPAKTVLMWLFLMGSGLLTAWIIKHIPKIGKYILYVK